MANLLSDSFSLSGTDYNGFRKTVMEMDEKTSFVQMKIGDFMPATYAGKCSFLPIDIYGGTTVMEAANQLATVSKVTVSKLAPYEKEIRQTGFILLSEGRPYLMSKYAVKSFTRRIGLAGEEIDRPSLQRDMLIAKQMERHCDNIVCCVIKKENGYRKIFAVMAKNYKPLGQQILADIIDSLPPSQCYRWQIDNQKTAIHIEFPQLVNSILPDKIIPGLILSTSDIGESALSAKQVYRLEGTDALATGQTATIKHDSLCNEKTVTGRVKKVLTELISFPTNLAGMLGIHMTADEIREKVSQPLINSAGRKKTEKLLSVVEEGNAYGEYMKIFKFKISMTDSVRQKYEAAMGTIPYLFQKEEEYGTCN